MHFVRNRAPLLIALASLLALAACDDDSSGPSPAAEGSVVFSYSGAEAGSYNATGRFNKLRPEEGTFAVGARGEAENGEDALVVYAHTVRQDELFDEFLLSIENPQLGTVTCDADDDCSFGAFFIVGSDVEGDAEMIYSSLSGTVTITSINEDRARGQFTFQMEGFDLTQNPPTLQVTSGVFDVPVQNVD